MPDLSTWMTIELTPVMDAPTRAQDALLRINDNPLTIILRRNGSDLAAQVVRLEANNSARWLEGPNVAKGIQSWTVFGIRNHPTEPDTDIKRSDRFTLEGVTYEVMAIMFPLGEVQALVEATKGT